MGITATRNPRGEVTIRSNRCVNPSLETNQNGWTFSAADATHTNVYGNGFPRYGSQGLYKSFGGQPATWEDIGFTFRATNWPAGTTRGASIGAAVSIDGVLTTIKARFRDAGNAVLGPVQYGEVATSIAGVWGRPKGQFTAPAGTVAVDLSYVMLQQGRAPGAGTVFAVDGLLIEDGQINGDYFDGSTFPAGSGEYRTSWSGTANASEAFMFQLDPKTKAQPAQLADRYSYQLLSRNSTYPLLDGGVAAVVMQGTLRTGVLKLLFEDRATAVATADAHMGPGVWRYDDTDNPEMGMQYVVSPGAALAVSQDDTRSFWVLELPFSEVS